jgi:polar amino acid transport system substrate-binding protein
MHTILKVMVALAGGLCGAAVQARDPVRFLAVDGRSLPMGLMRATPHGPELAGGVIKDWQDALARELGRRPVTLVLPRKRQDWAVAGHKVDLRCFVSPAWLTPELIGQYDWPAPFMDVEERVIGPDGAPPVHALRDLEGKTIGGVHGYFYRKLNALFASGKALREDAPGETALLLKQLAGRTDYSVMRTLDFHYLRRNDTRMAALAMSPFVVSHFAMYCARTKYSVVTLQELSSAQERLLQAGALEKILQKYR